MLLSKANAKIDKYSYMQKYDSGIIARARQKPAEYFCRGRPLSTVTPHVFRLPCTSIPHDNETTPHSPTNFSILRCCCLLYPDHVYLPPASIISPSQPHVHPGALALRFFSHRVTLEGCSLCCMVPTICT